MSELWRVIDTGLREAAQNIALDRALLEARQAEEIPSTLRLARCAASALLGVGQSAEQELNLEYCNAHSITIQRRLTSGDAIYTDENQLDWQLYLHRRDIGSADMQAIAKRLCHAAATAISALGVEARFRPRNEIEAGGRKIAGSGSAFAGSALLYQGTLLLDLDPARWLRVLNTPAGQASDRTIAWARERVAGLSEVLGRRVDPVLLRRNLIEAFESEFDVEFQEGDLTLTEHARYSRALAQIDTTDWVHLIKRPLSDTPLYEAQHKFAGGVLRAHLIYHRPLDRIKQVWFSGDIQVKPQRTIADLEAVLHNTALERLERNVLAFFAERRIDMPQLRPDDFIAVIQVAARRPLVARSRA